jgi:cobalt/nickel transport protein
MENKHIIMLLAVLLIAIMPFILYPGVGEDQGYFTGADSNAEPVIEDTGYQPWFTPIWEPPSGEIESLLFALQAAIGAFIIGYFMGYYRIKKKDNQKS